jgi:hypothetical protein
MAVSLGVFMLALFTASNGKAPVSDIRNYLNIVSVKDHCETIGLFWYLFVELFKQHVNFYRCLYIIFFGVLAVMIGLNVNLYKNVSIEVASKLKVPDAKKQARNLKTIRRTLMLALYVSLQIPSLTHLLYS